MVEEKITLNTKEIRKLSIIGNLFAVLFVLAPFAIIEPILNIELKIYPFQQFEYLIVFMVLYIPVHELFHILPGIALGLRCKKIGFKIEKKIMPVAYVHLTGHIPLKRKRIVDLAPLFLLSIIPIFFMIVKPELFLFSLTGMAYNIVGSSGDLWIFYKTLKYNSKTIVEDLPSEIGMRIILK